MYGYDSHENLGISSKVISGEYKNRRVTGQTDRHSMVIA
jgi:hypothetical protein